MYIRTECRLQITCLTHLLIVYHRDIIGNIFYDDCLIYHRQAVLIGITGIFQKLIEDFPNFCDDDSL